MTKEKQRYNFGAPVLRKEAALLYVGLGQTRFDELRNVLNIAGRITPLVTAKKSPAWELSLYDEWHYWMAGVTEFPFVEKARAAASANPTVSLDVKVEIKALSAP